MALKCALNNILRYATFLVIHLQTNYNRILSTVNTMQLNNIEDYKAKS